MKYSVDQIPICDLCTDATKQCDRCGISYCVHFASNTDIRMCGNCLDDFKVLETIEVKTIERIADNGDVISRKRQIAKNLKLQGTDWLFAAAKISTLNDEEIDEAIEYHRAIKNSLVDERETRRIEYFKKLGILKSNLSAVDKQLRDAKIGADIDKNKVIKVKQKEAQKKKDKDLSAVATLLGAMTGTQLKPEDLAKMLQAMAAGVSAK